MRLGAVTLSVSSASGVRSLSFAARVGCPSNVELVTGADVNAWADGSRVMIGEGLLRRCATDDELALVIGHEMAHNLLHHRRRLAAEGVSVNGLLPLTATASAEVRATEEEADRFAVALAATAHFDLLGVGDFISELMSSGAPAGTTHPDVSRRVSLLRATIADMSKHHNR
jgi:predicted Zn-dependent protease